jgi:ribosome-binding ATPase YchF (GTP1/OBG family)
VAACRVRVVARTGIKYSTRVQGPYADYDQLETGAAARAAGELRIEGKEYVVQHGDAIHFRFNV